MPRSMHAPPPRLLRTHTLYGGVTLHVTGDNGFGWQAGAVGRAKAGIWSSPTPTSAEAYRSTFPSPLGKSAAFP